jgi:hypothetical protein
MFQSQSIDLVTLRASLTGLSSSLSSALAYASDLADARITVTDDCGVIVLEGEAPTGSLARISEIASSIVGFRFCNLIRPT